MTLRTKLQRTQQGAEVEAKGRRRKPLPRLKRRRKKTLKKRLRQHDRLRSSTKDVSLERAPRSKLLTSTLSTLKLDGLSSCMRKT